jgi:hypothetical protein
MSLRVYYEVLNQKGSPALFTDTLANRPAFGFQGRLFISTDSGQIFEDTGTAWTLIADAGVGGGTLSSVCLNGNTTATGIVITAVGLTSTTGTFSGIVTTPQVKASTSAGLSINANSGTQVADFGAGGSANITFFGGLSGTSANFSSNILVNTLTIGRGSGTNNSTNSAIGVNVLNANTTGDANTGIGYLSMQQNTTGYGNTSIGNRSLNSNTIGYLNSAFGSQALQDNTTGTYNAALGVSSLISNTTGSNNTAVGWSSGSTNTTGSNNIFIGQASGGGITAGSFNTIIGTYTGTAGLSSNIVLADGQGNVRYRWDGTNNVFGNPLSGTSASFSSTVTGSSLIKSGGTAAQILAADGSVITAGTNITISGGTISSSSTAIAIGGSITSATAGSVLFAGTSGVLQQDNSNFFWDDTNNRLGIGTTNPLVSFQIGNNSASYYMNIAGSLTSTYIGSDNNGTYIGNDNANPIRFVPNNTEAMRITSVGELLVGTTSDSFYNGSVQGTGLFGSNGFIAASRNGGSAAFFNRYTSTGDIVNFRYAGSNVGSISYNGVNTLYNATSDYRLKEDLKEYNALEIISKLKTYDYKWKESGIRDYGMVAHELQEILPNYVNGEKDAVNKNGKIEPQGVDYSKIVPILIKAIQELNAKLN